MPGGSCRPSRVNIVNIANAINIIINIQQRRHNNRMWTSRRLYTSAQDVSPSNFPKPLRPGCVQVSLQVGCRSTAVQVGKHGPDDHATVGLWHSYLCEMHHAATFQSVLALRRCQGRLCVVPCQNKQCPDSQLFSTEQALRSPKTTVLL